MLRHISRRYAPEVTTVEAPVEMAQEKPTASRRRVLGDITNAYADEKESNKGVKKTVFSSIVSNHAELPTTGSVKMVTDEIDNHVVGDRVYMQRPSDDIDARDEGNPLLCTTYVNEMYEHFNTMERQFAVNASYITSQPYITERMRTILIDWLVEVHLKFKLIPETLYLTVNLIDRFLEQKQVRRSKLQLVGVAALLLASKYEEIYAPEMRDLVYITDRAYNKQEILDMESEIVNTLQFNLTVPTIHSFLCRYLKAGHADRTMVQLSCYLAERTLQEYSMVKYLPSTIAACAVYIARKSLKRHPWSPTLVKYSKYDEEDLAECVQEMAVFLNDTTSQQQAVSRKYASSKFGSVAKTPLQI